MRVLIILKRTLFIRRHTSQVIGAPSRTHSRAHDCSQQQMIFDVLWRCCPYGLCCFSDHTQTCTQAHVMKFCLCRRCLEDNRCKVTQLNRSRKSVCSCVRLLPLVHTVIKPGGQRIAWMLTVKECFPSLRIHFVLLVCLFVKLPVRLSICEPVCSSVCLPRFVPLPVGHVYDPSGHFFFFKFRSYLSHFDLLQLNSSHSVQLSLLQSLLSLFLMMESVRDAPLFHLCPFSSRKQPQCL